MKKIRTLLRQIRNTVLAYLNRNSEWKEYTPIQKELFQSLRPGDLIDAWMPLEAEELMQIEPDHRHRVYLVAVKNDKTVLAYPGTSKIDKYPEWARVILSAGYYRVWKTGCILCDRVVEIPIDCLIAKLDTLNEGSLREIDRHIRVHRSVTGKKLPDFATPVSLRTGDIIRKDDRYYYIFGIDTKLHTFHMHPTEKEREWLLRTPAGSFAAEVYRDITFPQNTDCELYYTCREGENERMDYLRRKCPAKKYREPKRHYYTHDVGEYFEDQRNGEKMIYIYSSNGRDYGIRERDLQDLSVRRIAWEYTGSGKSADDDLVTDILNGLIDSNRSRWGWLDELMVWE